MLLLLLCTGAAVRRRAEVEAAGADGLVARQYGVVEVGLQCGRPGRRDRPVGERLSICAVITVFLADWKPLFNAATVMPRFDATVFV